MNDMYLQNQWPGCCGGTILIPDSGDRGWQISEFKPSLYYTVSSKITISTILRKQKEEREGRGEKWGEEEKKIENESIYFSGSFLVASEISEKKKRKKPKQFREC